MRDFLKKVKKDKADVKTVFSRSAAFYSVVALVLVAVSLFTCICTLHIEKNELSDKNDLLNNDKSSLLYEIEANNKTIAAQNAQIEAQKDALDKKEQELDNIVSENEKTNERNEAALDEIMDYIGMEIASRSGGAMYDSMNKIDTVAYMIREKFGDNEDTAEHLKYLSELKSELSVKTEHFPDYSPLEHGTLTSRFGYRVDPNGNGTKYHSGIDVWNGYGTPIYAAGAGKVITAGDSGQYGLVVVIDHGYGYKTVYAHCSSLNVSVGDTVAKGQFIARIGATGNATGNHLHFELKLNDSNINPLDYVFPQFR